MGRLGRILSARVSRTRCRGPGSPLSCCLCTCTRRTTRIHQYSVNRLCMFGGGATFVNENFVAWGGTAGALGLVKVPVLCCGYVCYEPENCSSSTGSLRSKVDDI
ncbi:hypothetical protein PTKIN_Ptkin01aG0021200 [Pterospermum kingtungense]